MLVDARAQMFFRSPLSLLLAAILIVFGSVQLFFGWSYGEAAKSEATAIGVFTYMSDGRDSYYNYAFEINGVKLQQDCGTCRTALSPQGCKVGAPVLVYYAHTPVLETRLQEFGAASRDKYFMGSGIAGCGLLLIGLFFILKRTGKDSEEPTEADGSGSTDEPDAFPIASRD